MCTSSRVVYMCRYGYVTFVLKTQLAYGYLGIGFGELPVLMIPGDGVWGWINADGTGEVVAYRMVSYVTQEIADDGHIADESGYLADGSMSMEGSILTFNCTLPLNLTTDASGGEVVVPILANGSLTHFQWFVQARVLAIASYQTSNQSSICTCRALSDNSIGVTMHTEWGSLDIDLSAFNSTPEETTSATGVGDVIGMYAALGVWLVLLIISVTILKCVRSNHGRRDFVRRSSKLSLFCNRPIGQLCHCCRIAHYDSSRWVQPLRAFTLDIFSVVS